MKRSNSIIDIRLSQRDLKRYVTFERTEVRLPFSEYIINTPSRSRGSFIPMEPSRMDSSTNIEIMDLEPLGRSGEHVPIAAVDASSNVIGYSGELMYELLRAAIVVRENTNGIKVIKLGPIIVRSLFERGSFLYELESTARSIAVKKIRKGIVLLDGDSITSRPPDSQIYPEDSNGNNKFISLSKTVPLHLPRGADAFPRYPFIAKLSNKNAYFVRLSTNGFILNAMISTDQMKSAVMLFESLINSDVLEIGYPRTIKLAHIYSKILPMDILSARLALFEKHNIKARNKIDGRKLLLGCLWS